MAFWVPQWLGAFFFLNDMGFVVGQMDATRVFFDELKCCAESRESWMGPRKLCECRAVIVMWAR